MSLLSMLIIVAAGGLLYWIWYFLSAMKPKIECWEENGQRKGIKGSIKNPVGRAAIFQFECQHVPQLAGAGSIDGELGTAILEIASGQHYRSTRLFDQHDECTTVTIVRHTSLLSPTSASIRVIFADQPNRRPGGPDVKKTITLSLQTALLFLAALRHAHNTCCDD